MFLPEVTSRTWAGQDFVRPADNTPATVSAAEVAVRRDRPWPPRERSRARCHVCQFLHRPKCIDSRAIRWPLAPLLGTVPGGGYRALMDRVRCSGAEVKTAAEDGLTDRQADHWAIALGTHPSMVWPGWDRAGLTVLDDLFINGNGWRPAWETDEVIPDVGSVAA